MLGFGIDEQFQIQRTTLVPIEIPLGAAAVAQPTGNVFLEGTLSPTGDLATQAQRIQTGILGDSTYTAPPDSGTVSNAQQPSIITVTRANIPASGTSFSAGDTYEYQLVWADDYTLGSPNPTESRPSDNHHSYGGGRWRCYQTVQLAHFAPFVRVYPSPCFPPQTTATQTDFFYVGQVDVSTTPPGDVLTDTMDDATAELNVPPIERSGHQWKLRLLRDIRRGRWHRKPSRPASSGPINVTNGRVTIDNIPQADIAHHRVAHAENLSFPVHRLERLSSHR